MTHARTAIAAIGVATLLYGSWLMFRWQSPSQVLQVVAWAAAGVILHDGVIAPLCLAAGWALRQALPRRLAAPAATALVFIGTIAVAGFAVLTRSHDGGPNRTLLDRDYPLGLGLSVLVVLGGVTLGYAAAGAVQRRRRSRRWQG